MTPKRRTRAWTRAPDGMTKARRREPGLSSTGQRALVAPRIRACATPGDIDPASVRAGRQGPGDPSAGVSQLSSWVSAASTSSRVMPRR